MQGKPKVIAILNEALQKELTAITQYFLHAEVCENWHYNKLGGYIKKLSIVEMKHVEALIEHILFLDSTPTLRSNTSSTPRCARTGTITNWAATSKSCPLLK